jgi:hypothetical protein
MQLAAISTRSVKFAIFIFEEIRHRSIHLEAKPPSRKPILIWLIVSQLLALASLFFWLVMAGLSVMAFDSGVTQEAWNFVIFVWAYPIWPTAFAIASWIAYARKKDKLAGILTTFTFLPVLVLIGAILVGNFMFSLR